MLNNYNLDEEEGFHKKSILETLHNKSEEEQEKDMLTFWENQMKAVNEQSKTEKTIQWQGFNIITTHKCEINKDLMEHQMIDNMMKGLGPTSNHDFPIKNSVKDCIEGTEDARKWFVSTMHIYIKNIIDIPKINSKHDESFFKSLYAAYINSNPNKSDQEIESEIYKEKQNKLKNIKSKCFDLSLQDVMDPFGKALFDLNKQYISKIPDFYELCYQDEHSKILSSIKSNRDNITQDNDHHKVFNSLLKLNNKTILDASFHVEPKDNEPKLINQILKNDLPLSNKEFFENALNLFDD